MDQIYQLSDSIYLEQFNDGALVLRMPDRNIFELNLSALKVITLTDGIRSVREVSEIFSKSLNIFREQTYSYIHALYQHLFS